VLNTNDYDQVMDFIRKRGFEHKLDVIIAMQVKDLMKSGKEEYFETVQPFAVACISIGMELMQEKKSASPPRPPCPQF